MVEEFFTSAGGKFEIGGMNLGTLLKGRKSPFYVYSTDVVRRKYDKLVSVFPDADIFYSLKPNPNPELLRFFRTFGAHAEVSSGGELQRALDAGFDPGNIIFVAPAKTEKEIALAVKNDIYAVVLDSRLELELVDKIAATFDKKVNIVLRLNTLEGPKDAPEIMVGVPAKFGFDEEKVIDDLGGFRGKHTVINGIQVYAGSQILDENVINSHIENVFRVALDLKDRLGINIRSIDFGGGFGVPYSENDRELDLSNISAKFSELRNEYDRHWPGCRYIFEVGRYLVAECGIFVTRVLRVKESRGETFVITDGGMNNFTRMAFMRVKHLVKILNKIEKPPTRTCIVAGPCCTPMDIIGDHVGLPEPEVGDVIGVFNAGAYGYSMSMHDFISFPRPEELVINQVTPLL